MHTLSDPSAALARCPKNAKPFQRVPVTPLRSQAHAPKAAISVRRVSSLRGQMEARFRCNESQRSQKCKIPNLNCRLLIPIRTRWSRPFPDRTLVSPTLTYCHNSIRRFLNRRCEGDLSLKRVQTHQISSGRRLRAERPRPDLTIRDAHPTLWLWLTGSRKWLRRNSPFES